MWLSSSVDRMIV